MISLEPGKLDLEGLIRAVAGEACKSLFDAYGVALEGTTVSNMPRAKVLLCGVIGFTGPKIRGTCILAATEEPIHESIPIAGSLRDWIAELSNQLVGRIKNKLLGFGVEVYVTSPAVVRGEHLTAPSLCEIEPLSFVSHKGSVFLWVDVEVDPGFALIDPPEAVGASEGEVLLF